MHHLIVNRCADGFGKALVIQEGGNCPGPPDLFLGIGVDRDGAFPRLDHFTDALKNIVEQMTCRTHLRDLCRIFQGDH